MSEVAKFALLCALGLVWIFLNVVGMLYVVKSSPTRISVAGVTSVATVIFGVMLIATGSVPNIPQSWVLVVAAGLMFFLVLLLWTYITPAVRGTTWNDMIESARSATRKSKKDRKQEEH